MAYARLACGGVPAVAAWPGPTDPKPDGDEEKDRPWPGPTEPKPGTARI